MGGADWWERPPFILDTLTVVCDHPPHKRPRTLATFGLAEVPERRAGEFRYAERGPHGPWDTGSCCGDDWQCYRRTFWAPRTPLTSEALAMYREIERAGEYPPGTLDRLDTAHARMVRRDSRAATHAGNAQADGEVALAHRHWTTIAMELTRPVGERSPYYHPLWGEGFAGRPTRYWYEYQSRNAYMASLGTGRDPRPPGHDRELLPLMYREGIGVVCDVCQRRKRSTTGGQSARLDVTNARLYELLDRVHQAGGKRVSLQTLVRLNGTLRNGDTDGR